VIRYELHPESGLLVLMPEGRLAAEDFTKIAAVVDPYIAEKGRLNALMIHAESFPGWQDFAALIAHLKFVKDHHRRIARIAAVSDSGFLAVMPRVAQHFLTADVRYFRCEERDKALEWLGDITLV
jgi:tRNA U38,U39,U40 pseudouridine synthase TruA